ncbi:MAG: choloylglycine hydrolase [Clostridia bacterium]|nr:choloylglycine hydrolase [Clostridia bacterium]
MCTAVSMKMREHYFGRNLDLEYTLNESVVITPRNFPLYFRRAGEMKKHHAFIGTAIVENGTPLYYDGTNERGLSAAALNFPEAVYSEELLGSDNVASFEFIPWILAQCETVRDVKSLLRHTTITKMNFSEKFKASPLHWLISDSRDSLTVEPCDSVLKIYENPVGVLTNSPEFPMQMFNLNNYMSLSESLPENTFLPSVDLKAYSRGMGAMGLPGDLSSMSRFVRAVFTKQKALPKISEIKSVSQFFHVLNSVCQQKGAVKLPDGKYEYTVYSSCCNTDSGVYYYTTYYNSTVRAVDMHKADLDSNRLKVYPMKHSGEIRVVN